MRPDRSWEPSGGRRCICGEGPQAPAHRDRYVDLLRAVAIAAVVTGHWLALQVTYDGGLHWRTKDELYEALLLRESIEVIEEFTAMLRRDPSQVRPCRFARASFLPMNPEGAELDAEAKADALAFTVRHAFEPAETPSPDTLAAAAAAEYISIFRDLIPPYRKWIYG